MIADTFHLDPVRSASPDQALLEQEPAILECLARYEAALAACSEAEGRAIALYPVAPSSVRTVEEILAQPQRVAEVKAAKERIYRETGALAAEQAKDALEDEFNAMVEEVSEMVATTLEGLLCKARLAKHCQSMAEGIVEDLLAMDTAGGAA